MPFKARLEQAIQEENQKAAHQRTVHVAGPSVLLVLYVVISGFLAVRVAHVPDTFGGGAWDMLGYGLLALGISLWLSKRYVLDRWLEAWEHIEKVRQANVLKIEAVMARMEAEERAKAEAANQAAPAPQSDPWKRALASSPPPAVQGEAAALRPGA